MADIQDFGEKIGGARKDIYKSRGMTVRDLAGIDVSDFKKVVIKDNIWNVPDYTQFKGVMEDCCIYYMKFVRDHIKAKMDIVSSSEETTRYKAELYIKFILTMKEFCESLRTKQDLYDAKENIFKAFKDEKGDWTKDSIYTPGLDTQFIRTVSLARFEVDYLVDECYIQGFPDNFKGALKGIKIRKTYANKFRITNSTKYLTDKEFNTKEEAIEYAKNSLVEELEGNRKRKKSTLVNIVRPQLEHIERIGPNIRNNVDATTDNILQYFDFRGGEFGNWNNQKDRQAYLNYIFDSLVDLSFIMKSPLDFIGLGKHNKKLAIAFGARGKSCALAHYEPERVVINLTKMKGAGSLAHEFGHAFDDFLGAMHGIRGTECFLSSSYKRTSRASKTLKAMSNLMELIHYREFTDEELDMEREEIYNDRLKKATSDIKEMQVFIIERILSDLNNREKEVPDGLREKIRSLVEIDNFEEFKRSAEEYYSYAEERSQEYLARMMDHTGIKFRIRDNLEPKEKIQVNRFNRSKFYRAALVLDKGRREPYYSYSVEMFARLFESYIEDKLTELGLVSQYLVHSTTNNKVYGGYQPYPCGHERKVFNEAMAKVIECALEEFGGSYKNKIDLQSLYNKDRVSYIESIKVENVGNTRKQRNAAENKTSKGNIPDDTSELKKHLLLGINTSEKIDENKCGRYMDCIAIMGKVKLGYGYIGFGDISKMNIPDSNSKVYIDTMIPQRGRSILISSKAKPEKQLEGLIEAIANRVVSDKYGNTSAAKMITEGVTYTLCKRFGLDVRTYCMSSKFETLVKNPNQIGSYLDICRNIYYIIMDIITK